MRIEATYIPMRWVMEEAEPSTPNHLNFSHSEKDYDNAVAVVIVAILPGHEIGYEFTLPGAVAIPSGGNGFIYDTLDHFSDIVWPEKGGDAT